MITGVEREEDHLSRGGGAVGGMDDGGRRKVFSLYIAQSHLLRSQSQHPHPC